MDIWMVFRFVHDHNDKVIGTLVALFLVTSILLLIRSIGEKSEASSAGGSVDLNAIEGAMRKVLASQPVSVTVSSGAAGGHDDAAPYVASGEGGPEVTKLQEVLSAREKKIAELSQELEAAKSDLESKGASGGGGDAVELQSKLEEAQARLAEYEIIEDDIADLSLFKDENARLKQEVDSLKEQLEKAAQAPPPPVSKVKVDNEASLKFEKADKFELDPDDDVMKAFAAAAAGGAPTPAPAPAAPALNFETAEKFELDPNDDIMKQFAAAVDVQKAAPTPSAFSLPKADAEAVMKQSAPAPAPASADPQSAIDAMFAAAQSEKAPPPADDAQSAIDAMFAAAQGERSQPAPATAPAPSPAADDPQALIDAMFASAQADAKPAAPMAELVAEPAVSAAASDDDPLAGILDTDKMLSEVASLDEVSSEVEDALAETLDTDKLLAEVDSMQAGDKAAGASSSQEQAPEDDLLAEFKDAKGS